MEMFCKTERKWLFAAAAFAAGGLAASRIAPAAAFWPVPAVLAALAFPAGAGLRSGAILLFALFASAAALFLREENAVRRTVDSLDTFNPGGMVEAVVSAESDAVPRVAADGSRWMAFDCSCGGVGMRVSAPFEGELVQAGDRWLCRGWLSRRRGEIPRRFRFTVKGPGSRAVRVGRGPFSEIGRMLRDFRRRLEENSSIGLGGDRHSAALVRSLVFGGRGNLSAEDRREFAAAGTVHIFAVSGLHVTAIAQMLYILLVLLSVPARLAAAAAVPVLLCYVWSIGFPASAARAFAAVSLYFSSMLVWRRPNAPVALSAAFIAAYLCNPHAVCDAGAAFSYTVSFALVAASRARRGRRGRDLLFTAVIAWAAGVPVSAAVFGRISLIAPIANMAAVPFAGFAVCAGVLGSLAGFVSAGAASHFNNFAALAGGAMEGISRFAASLPGACAEVPEWPAWECAAWYAALALGLSLLRRKSKKFGIIR